MFEEAQKQMDELTGAAGGFLVPPQLAKGIIDVLRSRQVIQQLNPMVVTGLVGNSLDAPRIDEGSSGYWVGESESKTESVLELGMLELRLKEAAALVKVSNNLLEDSTPTADTIVKNDMGRALATVEQRGILVGTGGGMPLGILNWPGLNTTAWDNTDGGTMYDSLIDAITALENRNSELTGWLVHPTDKGILRKIKDTQDHPIWQSGLQAKEPDTLLGYPLFYTTDMTAGNILLGDWRDLLIIEKRAGIVMKASDEAGDSFTDNQTWFRATRRVDSGPRRIASFQAITGVTA